MSEEVSIVLNQIKDLIVESINFNYIILIITIILSVCLSLYITFCGIRLLVKFTTKALHGDISIDSGRGSFDYAGGNKDRELYKDLLSWEHEKGIYHKDDSDFL